MIGGDIQARYIGQLSLMQSVMIGLPDEKSIAAFVCRGLTDMPGVKSVEFVHGSGACATSEVACYKINRSENLYLRITLADAELYRPYEQYISNFASMLEIIFEERKQREEIDYHKKELEDRVEERTCQLKNEVEERLQIEESLRKSEELFRLSFDHTIIGGYMLDREGRFIRCNTAFCHMIGYREDELLGTDILHVTAPDEVSHTQQILEQLRYGSSVASQYEKHFIRRSGEIITAKVSATAVRNSGNETEFIISYVNDISEAKQLQTQLMNSEQKYRSLFENLTAGMLLLKIEADSCGKPLAYRITEANQAFCKISGIEPDKAAGRNIADVFPCINDKYISWLNNAVASGRLEAQEEYIEALGRYFDVWVFFPETSICAIMLSDVSERVRTQEILLHNEQALKDQNEEYEALNEELSERNIQLQASKEKAEESDRLKSAFLANMSHEIRTPMNGIIGFSDLIGSGDITDHKRHYYSDIVKSSCMQLLSIVNDIIDISKIETGQIRLDENKVNTNDLLLYLYSFYKPVSQKNNVSLYLNKDLSDRQSVIYTDEVKLKQILNNFLSNAAKFTHTGHIQFGYQRMGDRLEFYVEDTGIGIACEDHELIFDRFGQARHQDSNVYGGTGLGLAIAKAYIEKLGGNVQLESTPDVGSRFSFSIPYRPVFPDADDSSGDSLDQSKLPVILVVEDEEVNYLYLEEVLRKENVQILHAKNGAETIRIINSDQKIDLILLDIKLPDANGLDLLPQIYAVRPNASVVAQTAYAMSGDREKSLAAGCCDYIAKPIMRPVLLEILNKYLERK